MKIINKNTNIPNISYDKLKRTFLLKNIKSHSIIDENINAFVSKFENNKKLKKYYKSLKVDELKFHDYEDNMLKYCFDVLDKKLNHDNTKWIKNYSNLLCLGVISKKIYFEDKKVLKFFNHKKFHHLKKDLVDDFITNKRKNFFFKNGWLFYKKIDKKKIKNTIKKSINFISLKKNYYRVIQVVDSIKKNGWITSKSWNPHGSVLYFYKNKYMILTGRHRLVALKYCFLKGYIKNISFKFPILEGKSKIRNLNYKFKN